MKKIVSLLVVLVLAMSLATTAFALEGAGTFMEPYIVNSADDLVGYELTLEPGASVTFKFANAYAGATLVVSGGPVALYSSMNQGIPVGENAYQIVISGNFMWGYTVDVANESDAAQTYTMELVVPLGSTGNPEELTMGANACEAAASAGYDYYYTYTSTEAGTLTLTDIVLDTDVVDSYNIQISSDGFYNYSELLDENWVPKDSVSFEMAAGETALILVRAQDWDSAEYTELSFNAEFAAKMGTQDNPIFIQMATDLSGVDVAAGSETYLAISSMLNDQILTIVGDENTTVNVNGTDVTAVDGVFSVLLNGVPSNRVVVGNTGSEDASYVAFINYVPGTENNPYIIESAEDLTDLDAVGYSLYYYAISSRLNGQYLVIRGDENTSVIYNDFVCQSEDGVFIIELVGTPTNRLMVCNNAEENVTIEFEITEIPGTENNPYVIENAGDLTDLDAVGYSTYYYAISSRLNGQVLRIKGDENTSVNFNGVELEGENGVFTIELDGAPVNRLMICNYADENKIIEFEFVEKTPETGDYSIAGVVVCLMAATAGAVVIGKKKEF